jgi:hypothetical protein
VYSWRQNIFRAQQIYWISKVVSREEEGLVILHNYRLLGIAAVRNFLSSILSVSRRGK